MKDTLLRVKNLEIEFETKIGVVKVAEDISFEIYEGETLCLVGESGCGKSVVAMSIMGLLPENVKLSGDIWYRGKELLQCNAKDMLSIRGKEIAMIFEQPMSCLNPVMAVGEQIAEAYIANNKCSKRQAAAEAKLKLEEVGIPSKRYSEFPHELSGGMQQRVMIAIALACAPRLLIADEPTTSLDVTVQYQILDLLHSLKERYKMSLFMITHDLGVVAEMADKVGVMYAGTMMELSSVKDFFFKPCHPYSKALLNVVSGNKLNPIAGNVPNLMTKGEGCPFHSRCEEAAEQCIKEKPEYRFICNRMERCHFAGVNSSKRDDKVILSL